MGPWPKLHQVSNFNAEPLATGLPHSCGLVAPGPPPGGTPVPSAGGQTGVSSLEATPALRTCICCSVTPSPSPPEPDICFAGFPRFWTGVFPGVSAGLHFPREPALLLPRNFTKLSISAPCLSFNHHFFLPSIFFTSLSGAT